MCCPVAVCCAGWQCAHRYTLYSDSRDPHRCPYRISSSSANLLHCDVWYTARIYCDDSWIELGSEVGVRSEEWGSSDSGEYAVVLRVAAMFVPLNVEFNKVTWHINTVQVINRLNTHVCVCVCVDYVRICIVPRSKHTKSQLYKPVG